MTATIKKKQNNKNRKRNINISFRCSPEENVQINRMVALSGLTKQDYIIRKLEDQTIVVNGNPRVFRQLKTQMLQIIEELVRLKNTGELTDEYLEYLNTVTDLFVRMTEGDLRG